MGSIPGLATYFRFSFRFFKKGSCQLLAFGWLVGFGFNGPLRQYFSLYRAVSQREGDRGERIDESKNVQTTPTRTYYKRNRPLPYCNQNCRTPRHWKFTQHHRTTRPPLSYWRKYVHEVLVNRLGGLSLPRKSVVRLTDRPDMTLDVYRGRKTTIQVSISVYIRPSPKPHPHLLQAQ